MTTLPELIIFVRQINVCVCTMPEQGIDSASADPYKSSGTAKLTCGGVGGQAAGMNNEILVQSAPRATPRLRMLLLAIVVGGVMVAPVIILTAFTSVNESGAVASAADIARGAAGLTVARVVVVISALAALALTVRYRLLGLRGWIVLVVVLAAALVWWFGASMPS